MDTNRAADELTLLAMEMKARIKGDPHCNNRQCFGTGVVGIRAMMTDDGKPYVDILTCRCAKTEVSEYAVLRRQNEIFFQATLKVLGEQTEMLKTHRIMLDKMTLRAKIQSIIHRFRRPSNDSPPSVSRSSDGTRLQSPQRPRGIPKTG